MILTVLVICAVLALGILLGIEINQYFGNDNYWKGYDDGFADGYMEEYNIRESSKPTPSEFLEQFEEFLNSSDEKDDYDKMKDNNLE